jgi:hypothetical protein
MSDAGGPAQDPYADVVVGPRRAGCLTAVLVTMIGTSILTLLLFPFTINEARQVYSRLNGGVLVLSLLLSIAGVASLLAVWNWKKAGFFGFLAVTVASFALNLYVGAPLRITLLGLVGVVFLGLLMKQQWSDFE